MRRWGEKYFCPSVLLGREMKQSVLYYWFKGVPAKYGDLRTLLKINRISKRQQHTILCCRFVCDENSAKSGITEDRTNIECTQYRPGPAPSLTILQRSTRLLRLAKENRTRLHFTF